MAQRPKIGYLAWRCRRGTKELDVVLATFLETNYKNLSDDELHDFDKLLNSEDTDLWYWLSAQKSCPDIELKDIIEKIYAKN